MTDKEQLKQAYLEGYETGKGVEELQPISIKTAKSRFEQWWERNQANE